MLDADALERLASELRGTEWKRVRQARIWSLFADCRERELHHVYGWRRQVVMWAPPSPHARETLHARAARRAWYLRISPAQHTAAAAKCDALAKDRQDQAFLAQGLEDMLCELHAYEVVRQSLQHRVPAELVRMIWEHMDMEDAWEQLDADARCFLWCIGGSHVARRTRPPWQHSWWRNTIRRRWTALVLQLRQCRLGVSRCCSSCQDRELGDWDVLMPWRAGYQAWRLGTQ